MKQIEDFSGFITSLERTEDSLSMRLMPWDVNNDKTPVIVVSSDDYFISCSEGLTLESIKKNEYEIDEVELLKNKLSIWVYDFEFPVIVESSNLNFQFEPYNNSEYEIIIESKDKLNNEYYTELKMLRLKVNSVELFIEQQEQRIMTKSATHPEGSEGYRLYKELLNLLSKLNKKLNT